MKNSFKNKLRQLDCKKWLLRLFCLELCVLVLGGGGFLFSLRGEQGPLRAALEAHRAASPPNAPLSRILAQIPAQTLAKKRPAGAKRWWRRMSCSARCPRRPLFWPVPPLREQAFCSDAAGC